MSPIVEITRRRLAEVMGDIKVYFADNSLVADATGKDQRSADAGYYHPGAGAHGTDYIVINNATLRKRGDYATR